MRSNRIWSENMPESTSKVYFVPLPDGAGVHQQVEGVRQAYEAVGGGNVVKAGDFAAVKVHVGEKGGTTHAHPELTKEIVRLIKKEGAEPFLTETSTLYKGERMNGVKHLLHAHFQGFSVERVGAPFVMADGLLGNTDDRVEIHGELNEAVYIAKEILLADALVVMSHATGHIGTGLGACIKNLGMGLASRRGKLRQHSSLQPHVKENLCQLCGKCMEWCPQGAIVERNGKAFILAEQCIGCGECLTVCKFDAIPFNWDVGSMTIQKNMAEYALGVLVNKKEKAVFFNILVNMTKDCDCLNRKQQKIIPDVGIIASVDPVAVDKATLDMTVGPNKENLATLSYPGIDPMIQLRHAEKIGLGRLAYETIRVG